VLDGVGEYQPTFTQHTNVDRPVHIAGKIGVGLETGLLVGSRFAQPNPDELGDGPVSNGWNVGRGTCNLTTESLGFTLRYQLDRHPVRQHWKPGGELLFEFWMNGGWARPVGVGFGRCRLGDRGDIAAWCRGGLRLVAATRDQNRSEQAEQSGREDRCNRESDAHSAPRAGAYSQRFDGAPQMKGQYRAIAESGFRPNGEGREMRPGRALTLIVALATVVGALVGCEPSAVPSDSGSGPLIVVSVPLGVQPWVGQSISRGAELAASQLNLTAAPKKRIRLQIMDNGASPSIAAANARWAVAHSAAAMVTDGTGSQVVAQIAAPAALPIMVVFDGSAEVVDPDRYPTVFRLAPANRFLSRRLADYLAEKVQTVAVIQDDSAYGRDGGRQLVADLDHDGIAVARSSVVPVDSSDLSAQVQSARRSGAQALVVWAGAAVLAQVIRAARASGWSAPVYSGPTAEDPLVRQQLAAHPRWLDGTVFVSSRITSEQGPAAFERFRAAYEARYGQGDIGLSAQGRPVRQPPDWPMYAYDSVRLLALAFASGGQSTGAAMLNAVQEVSVVGANGDQRGFGAGNREAVSSGDMYLARFQELRFAPVTDDRLSTTLPPVAQ